MARTLFIWPTSPQFHPDPAQERSAKIALQAALGSAGDVDCDSFSEPRESRAGDEPYRARFVIRVCDALAELPPETLADVSTRLGCPCKQAIIDDGT